MLAETGIKQEQRRGPMSDSVAEDGLPRCAWAAGDDALYRAYHDNEWGRPVTDDTRLFEKLCLEGFQSGLSWITILRKRERFREVFHGFVIDKVAAMNEADIARLLTDPGIIRHRGKIASTINNARQAQKLIAEFGSLAAYVWRFEPHVEDLPPAGTFVAESAASRALSKDLRKRGFSFVGPTTAYAFMQAMGLVNDHAADCFCRADCEAERAALARPVLRQNNNP
jgi:DNA-3-methyladenine glycosylase I